MFPSIRVISLTVPRFWRCHLPQFTQITDVYGNTALNQSSGVPQAPVAPLPDIPEERNAEAFPLVLAWQQHATPAGKFRPVPCVLLPLHGGKAGPQEHGMLAILGV